MSYILQTVTEQLNSNEMYNEVKSFFKTNKPGTGEPVSCVAHSRLEGVVILLLVMGTYYTNQK